jgi:hypothetical protein
MASSRPLLSGRMSRQSFSWYSAPQISRTDMVSSPTLGWGSGVGVGWPCERVDIAGKREGQNGLWGVSQLC